MRASCNPSAMSNCGSAQTGGLVRDRLHNPAAAWVARDSNYRSARWQGDVHSFAQQFAQMLAPKSFGPGLALNLTARVKPW